MSYSISDIEEMVYNALDEAEMTPASGQHLKLEHGRMDCFQVAGDRNGTKNGAVMVYMDDRPAGWCQNWKTGVKRTFSMKGLPPLDAEAQEKFRQEMEAARQKRAEEEDQKHKETAQLALSIWKTAHAADPEHPYLKKKGVTGYTLKQNDEALLVPLYDGANIQKPRIINLQRIFANGEKRPLTGGLMKGVFSPIGKNPEGPILVCEGWATGAALYRLTNYTVVCAMTAGNLTDTARMVKLNKPDREVLICADNDHETEAKTGKNPGRNYAIKAAEQAKLGAPIWPDFTDEEDGSDWDDYMLMHGEEAARAHFKQKYDEARVIANPCRPGTWQSGCSRTLTPNPANLSEPLRMSRRYLDITRFRSATTR